MERNFYLSSHDIGADSRPRKCEIIREVEGLRAGSRYLLVSATPPLKTRFRDGAMTDFDRIILSIMGRRSVQDIGTQPVSAEIVLCPYYGGGTVDEMQCSRIGTAGLHATYAEALANSPVEIR